MPASLASSAADPKLPASRLPSAARLLSHEIEDGAQFLDRFDHTPFQFRHCLDRHPLFQIEALLAAAERLTRSNDTKSHFESGGARPQCMVRRAPARQDHGRSPGRD